MVHKIKGEKVIGLKQTKKFLENSKGECLYVAKDAEGKLTKPIIELAEKKELKVIYIDNMKELGALCKIDVGAAVALLLT